jgi:hypothetical protein
MNAPKGVKGKIVPNATNAKMNAVIHFPGRLVKKGRRLVLITNMINTSVQNYSTNHPLWNIAAA